jgi:hypothetical protein
MARLKRSLLLSSSDLVRSSPGSPLSSSGSTQSSSRRGVGALAWLPAPTWYRRGAASPNLTRGPTDIDDRIKSNAVRLSGAGRRTGDRVGLLVVMPGRDPASTARSGEVVAQSGPWIAGWSPQMTIVEHWSARHEAGIIHGAGQPDSRGSRPSMTPKASGPTMTTTDSSVGGE